MDEVKDAEIQYQYLQGKRFTGDIQTFESMFIAEQSDYSSCEWEINVEW